MDYLKSRMTRNLVADEDEDEDEDAQASQYLQSNIRTCVCCLITSTMPCSLQSSLCCSSNFPTVQRNLSVSSHIFGKMTGGHQTACYPAGCAIT